jgi:hypothetical protein
MKRSLAILLTLLMCLALCVPVCAADENQQKKKVVTTYVTEDGVVVRVFSSKTVNIRERAGDLVIDGKAYSMEGDLQVARGSSIPSAGYYLSDGPHTQTGTISAGGSTYSDKLYYPSNQNGFNISYSGTAESKGGKSGEVYLFAVRLYNSQHTLKQADFWEHDRITLTGKIVWSVNCTFPYELSEFCYLKYSGIDENATSYNITVS